MNSSASRSVSSSQTGLHPQLAKTVQRHFASPWLKPAQRVDKAALAALDRALAAHPGPLVLDSFCGTGMSTALLAERYPEALVIGVDKSADRLGRHAHTSGNYLLLQAHCEALWRHLAESGRQLQAHYILYPNPWPKPTHLGRRVHGHPAFPLLLSLGGIIELRSNWQIYVEEFGVALHLAGVLSAIASLPTTGLALTLFEQKYCHSGQTLWQLRGNLAADKAQRRNALAVKPARQSATLSGSEEEQTA
ncbi:MAG: tRNA (guanine-N7-)-methyltransferase [Halieaceae bacterium]|jgi:tRNA (guanine-N7-)-methyltransferase